MSPRVLTAGAALTVLTILFAIPLSTAPATSALDLGPDTRLFLWTLAWDAHALASAPFAIFDANIFYPEPRTLAYSEHQIGSALIASPIIYLTNDPLLAMNLVLLLSCMLSGVGAFVLARELGLSSPAAWLCAVIFAFSPPRFFRLGQLHLATVQWIPFCLALVHRYAKGGSRRHIIGAALLFTLQAWSGGQSGLFLATAVVGLGAYLVATGHFRPPKCWKRDFAYASVIVLALNVPLALPYLTVRGELGLERTIDEALVWSPNIESFVASPTHAHRLARQALGWDPRVSEQAKAFLFPGLMPLVMCALAFVARKRVASAPKLSAVHVLDALILTGVAIAVIIEAAGGVRIGPLSASSGGRALVLVGALLCVRIALDRRSRPGKGLRAHWTAWAEARMGVPASFYVALLVFSVWASLGPRYGLYEALYNVVPGFDFIRVPSRLTLLSVLAIAVLAGFGIESWTRGRRLLPYLLSAITLAELAAFPLDAPAYAVTISAMDTWLSEHDAQGAVAVFPIPDPREDVASARSHSSYMLSSTVHFRSLVNGYSGFIPESHRELYLVLTRFPSDDGAASLRALGTRFVVFHRSGYDDTEWRRIEESAVQFGMVRRASFPEGLVFELQPR